MNEDEFRRYLLAKARQHGSKAKLAAAIGEHRPTLSKVISGHRDPTPKILAYLGLERGYEFVRLPKLPTDGD